MNILHITVQEKTRPELHEQRKRRVKEKGSNEIAKDEQIGGERPDAESGASHRKTLGNVLREGNSMDGALYCTALPQAPIISRDRNQGQPSQPLLLWRMAKKCWLKYYEP